MNVPQVQDVLTLQPPELPPEDLLLAVPLLLHQVCHHPPLHPRPQQLSLRPCPTLHAFISNIGNGLIYVQDLIHNGIRNV